MLPGNDFKNKKIRQFDTKTILQPENIMLYVVCFFYDLIESGQNHPPLIDGQVENMTLLAILTVYNFEYFLSCSIDSGLKTPDSRLRTYDLRLTTHKIVDKPVWEHATVVQA